jgi:hypothetical protein
LRKRLKEDRYANVSQQHVKQLPSVSPEKGPPIRYRQEMK